MLLNVALSNPSGFSLSRILRNALTGAFVCTQPRALSRSITCSSVNKAMVLSRLSLLVVQQAEHSLGDDVVLHFGGAGEDRHGLVGEEGPRSVDLFLLE